MVWYDSLVPVINDAAVVTSSSVKLGVTRPWDFVVRCILFCLRALVTTRSGFNRHSCPLVHSEAAYRSFGCFCESMMASAGVPWHRYTQFSCRPYSRL